MSAAIRDFQDHIEAARKDIISGNASKKRWRKWGAEKSVHYIFDVA